MDNLKAMFRNRLIRYKIILIYIPLIVLPLLILGWISNYIFTAEIKSKAYINVKDDSSLIVTRITSLVSNAESCANIIVKDINNSDIKPLFNLKEEDVTYAYDKRIRITHVLDYALIIFPEVESAAFIDSNNELYYTSKNLNENLSVGLQSDIIKKIKESNGINLWFPMQKRNFLANDSNKAILTLGKKVLDIDGGNMLGALILNIKEDMISSIYDNIGLSKGSNYLIADNNGVIISARNKKDLFKPKNRELTRIITDNSANTQKTILVDNEKVLITPTTIEKMNWTLINQTNLNQLTKESKKLSYITLWIGLICVAIALFGGSLLSNLIAKPIVSLTKKMQKVKEGSLDIQYEVNSTDEIGQLASGFNSMLERIRSLLEKVNLEQRKKREFELALVQAQIKPHFLYNTLDLIYVFSDMGRSLEAKTTTKNLADFYRIALSKGKEIITVEEELKNVENYLSIQRVRYSDIFDYEIKADPEVLHSLIPKLTIQPIVENSIYHGLKLKGSFGKLLIESYPSENNVIIKITDNGVGIPVEKLNRIIGSNHAPKESFGLSNVNERIKLYFGEEYSLKIDSLEQQWTIVTIRIPRKMEGIKDND